MRCALNRLGTAILFIGSFFLPLAATAQTTIQTGIQTDLAILGPGYFVVREPNENLLYVTRRGAFYIDSNGYWVTSTGLRLQGFTNSALTEVGDLRIDSQGRPASADPSADITDFFCQSDGRLMVTLQDGTTYVRGQVLLQSFGCPSNLRRIDDGCYVPEQSAIPLPQPVPPDSAGPGVLVAGQLEVPEPRLALTRLPAQVDPSAQGVLHSTGIPTDLALCGRGFFVVRDSTNNALYATKAGTFFTDPMGYLINYAGLRVQGYTNAELSGIGDVQIDRTGCPPTIDPAAEMVDFWVNRYGKIGVMCTDGTTFIRGQILLQDCANTALLVKTNFGLYPLVDTPGLWTGMTAPGYGSLSCVFSGLLEVNKLDESVLSFRQTLNFFVQGPLHRSESPTDLAVCGYGLFIVRDPNSNLQYATRCGAFHLDANSYLVTSNGFRVQGFANSGLTVPGDIVVNSDGAPSLPTNATVAAFSVACDGKVILLLSDGSCFVRGQILLQWFRNPQALRKGTNQLYSNLEAALPMFTNCAPGSHVLGEVVPFALEDLTTPELRLPPQSGFRLLISDVPAGVSLVETSSDCKHWTSLEQIDNSGLGEAEVFDAGASEALCRFYRVRTPLYPFTGGSIGPPCFP